MKKTPIHWVQVSGKDIFQFVTSGSRGWAKYYSDEGSKFIRVGNIDHGSISLDLSSIQYVKPPIGSEGERTRLQFNDILISITADIGMVAVVPNDFGDAYINQHIALARPVTDVIPRFIAWYMASDADGKAVLKISGRGGTKVGLGLDDIRNIEIPLAPLPEQRRIAEKLDITLARIDALNDRLARITPLLQRFRQSVLAAATSGRLTEDWRQHKDIPTLPWKSITEFKEQILPSLPNSWKWVEFSEVASVQSDLRDPSEYQNEIHLAPNHIAPWSGKISGCQTIADDAVKSPKHWFNAGQIVYSKIRPNLCKVAIPDFSGLCSADMYPISTKLNDSYFLLWMLSERFTSWASNAESRTVLPKINTKELGKIPVPVTSAEEQTKIVRRVEILFAFADRLEARLQSAQTAAERLTPALLAKAFRGELVPQDPSDEPATELLRRLREARAAEAPTKPKRGRKAAAT